MLFVEMKTLKSDFGLTWCHTKMSYLILKSQMPLDNLLILTNFLKILKDFAVFEVKLFN